MTIEPNEILNYKITRKEGWDITTQSSSAYDKAIISLSTASFGFVAAIAKFFPNSLVCKSLLILILVLLILAIFSSLLSFWFDQLFGNSLIIFAEISRENQNEKYKKDWSYYASLVTKILSGAFFLCGLILFLILFSINL